MPKTNDQLWELLNDQILGRLKTIDKTQSEINTHLAELNGTVADNAERCRANDAAIKEQWARWSEHKSQIAVLETEGRYHKEGAVVATADRTDLRKDVVKLALQVAATGGGAAAAIAIAKAMGWL